jgi:UDP-N-acetylbacillosamine N-acetyltransferase
MSLDSGKLIAILGCGGHARSIANVLLSEYPDIEICFIDPRANPNEVILNCKTTPSLNHSTITRFIAGIGDNIKRKTNFQDTSQYCTPISVISKSAHQGINSVIGPGTFIAYGTFIGPEAIIGPNCIINTHGIIEHEVHIGPHTHVAPNATICGRSKIGECVFVGAGATIIDNIKICSNVIIGAGSVVVSNIDKPGSYVGVPAKKITD